MEASPESYVQQHVMGALQQIVYKVTSDRLVTSISYMKCWQSTSFDH